MSSSIRPPTKIQCSIPVPPSKSSLYEMTESQSNVRATGLPLPSSSSLKHKAIDRNADSYQRDGLFNSDICLVAEPPSKQRKVGATQSAVQAANSATVGNRMAASANGIRPPSRTMLGTSQYTGTRGPLAASTRAPTSNHISRPNGLKIHGRSKSQLTGLRPSATRSSQSEEDGKESNGMHTFSVPDNVFKAPLSSARNNSSVSGSSEECYRFCESMSSSSFSSASKSQLKPAVLLPNKEAISSLSSAMSAFQIHEVVAAISPESHSPVSTPLRKGHANRRLPRRPCAPAFAVDSNFAENHSCSLRKTPVALDTASLKT